MIIFENYYSLIINNWEPISDVHVTFLANLTRPSSLVVVVDLLTVCLSSEMQSPD